MTRNKPLLTGQTKVSLLAILLYVMFTILALISPGVGDDNYLVTIFGATTFIFGILLGFYISTSSSRFNSVTSALQAENSTLLYLYYSAKPFEKKTVDTMRKLIDSYLIAQLDYFLKDFDKSEKEFSKLFEFINDLPTKTEDQSNAKDNMLSEIYESLRSRKQIESNVTATMSPLEWTTLLALLAISLTSLFLMNTDTTLAAFVTAALATTSVLLLTTLEQLDSLRWKEDKIISQPLARVFTSLGLPPYYPKAAIEEGRFTPLPGKIRLATYPNPYPDMTGKRVETVEWEE